MARASSCIVLILLVLVSSSFLTNTEARKLLPTRGSDGEKQGSRAISIPALFRSLLLSALPKGTVPPSSPSKKGHATLDNVERFQRHVATIDRILRSVPSPGVGH